jgi:hypothetical protein
MDLSAVVYMILVLDYVLCFAYSSDLLFLRRSWREKSMRGVEMHAYHDERQQFISEEVWDERSNLFAERLG